MEDLSVLDEIARIVSAGEITSIEDGQDPQPFETDCQIWTLYSWRAILPLQYYIEKSCRRDGGRVLKGVFWLEPVDGIKHGEALGDG